MENFPYTPEEAIKKLNRYLYNAGLVGSFYSLVNAEGELEFIKERGIEEVVYPAQAALGLIDGVDTVQRKAWGNEDGECPQTNRRKKCSKKKAPRGPGRYSKPVS